MTSYIRVLLVEDDPSDATLIRRSLSRSSVPFRVEHFDRLSTAQSFLQDNIVDVVLLDLGLPDGDGQLAQVVGAEAVDALHDDAVDRGGREVARLLAGQLRAQRLQLVLQRLDLVHASLHTADEIVGTAADQA